MKFSSCLNLISARKRRTTCEGRCSPACQELFLTAGRLERPLLRASSQPFATRQPWRRPCHGISGKQHGIFYVYCYAFAISPPSFLLSSVSSFVLLGIESEHLMWIQTNSIRGSNGSVASTFAKVFKTGFANLSVVPYPLPVFQLQWAVPSVYISRERV